MSSETTSIHPRHPLLIIRKIMDTIVWEEVAKEKELRHELTYLLEDSPYRPCEQYYEIFLRLAKSLDRYLGEPDNKWKKEISSIMMNG